MNKPTIRSRDHSFRLQTSRQIVTTFLIGAIIAILATVFVSASAHGRISLSALIQTQRDYPVLWLLNLLPFVLPLWMYHVGESARRINAFLSRELDELMARNVVLEEQAVHHVTHDVLTDLPNRSLLLDRLDQTIHSAHHRRTRFAILRMDLDRFKEINDALSHEHGDLLLKQVVTRLLAIINETVTVARVGGDEFVVVLPVIASFKDATDMAAQIGKALEAPFLIEDSHVDAQASIGIAVYPDHGTASDTLLQRAEVAMYLAKHEKSRFSLYDPIHDKRGPRRLALTAELRHAIDNDGLLLLYQPKVKMTDGTVPEFEGLLRWSHPSHDVLSPREFIPLAERTGLIRQITHWVLTNALHQLNDWHEQGLNARVAVNVSAQDLHDGELVNYIAKLLKDNNILPNRLVLELTETSIMINEDRATDVLEHLADMGVRLSIDDFGTGYSSLSHLSELPVNEIKIDQSFVGDMVKNPTHKMIVCATIDLARNLGIEVIGEGVADEQTYRQLEDLGCHSVQGFFISRPLHAHDVAVWAKSSRWTAH